MQGLITYYPAIMDIPDKPASLVSATAAYLTALWPGDTNWTCPYSGFWSFVIRGPGAWRGGSGAAAKRTVYLTAGQNLTFTIGNQQKNPSTASPKMPSTIVNFPDGLQMIAEGSQTDAVVVAAASGGDINVAGTLTGDTPAIDTFPASTFTMEPVVADSYAGRPPGVGGGSNGFNVAPGPGVLYIYSVGS